MEPEVIIIYVPGDGNGYSFQARRNGVEWRYGKPVTVPQKDLSRVCQDLRDEGWVVLDIRKQADAEKPGMSEATPILVFRPDFDPKLATEAMAQLHTAILDLANTEEKGPTRKPDFYFLWTSINPALAFCNAFWNYGEEVGEHVEFPSSEMETRVDTLQKELGGAVLETPDPRAFVVCRKGVNGKRAAKAAKSFWIEIGLALLMHRQRRM